MKNRKEEDYIKHAVTLYWKEYHEAVRRYSEIKICLDALTKADEEDKGRYTLENATIELDCRDLGGMLLLFEDQEMIYSFVKQIAQSAFEKMKEMVDQRTEDLENL